MPVDVVESWLACSDEQVRLDALESPAAPRNILWEHLTKDVNFAEESSAGYNVFAYESNADGDMIDWFLTRWEKQARDELYKATRRRWVAEAALSHPRARATTLERLYARYGSSAGGYAQPWRKRRHALTGCARMRRVGSRSKMVRS